MDTENQKTPITFDEIAQALARDYNSIYVIDAADDSYVEYVAEDNNKTLVQRAAGSDFYKDLQGGRGAAVASVRRKSPSKHAKPLV